MSHTCNWAAAGSHNGGVSVKAGKKGTIHVSAKAMNITWANDARFWKWIPLSKNEQPKAFSKDDMSFDAAAELIQVNWLEARGSLDSAVYKQPRLSGSGRYEIIYHLRFKVDAFGWSNAPVTFELITADGHRQQKSVMLEPYRRRSNNEWQEIHGGELKMTGKVEFAMFQVDSHGWKGGIIFGGVSLRPK